jgi:hypothetical protein
LEAFENRALRGIFGPRRDEIIDERKLRNKNHNVCPSLNLTGIVKSRRKRWERHIARLDMRNVYQVLVGKPDGNRPLGRPGLRLEKYIKSNITEIEWGEVINWTHRITMRKS